LGSREDGNQRKAKTVRIRQQRVANRIFRIMRGPLATHGFLLGSLSALFFTLSLILLFGLLLLLSSFPCRAAASATPKNQEKSGAAACFNLVERDPAAALTEAGTWVTQGGGPEARACRGLAALRLGRLVPAAEDLDAAGRSLADHGGDAKLAGNWLAQAGWAWLRAGQPQRAERSHSQALALRGPEPDLLIDRAFARVEAGKLTEAVADLTEAITRKPQAADAHLYRATALRRLGRWNEALQDANRALTLRPNDPDALLLRGNLHALLGRMDEARRDWRTITTVAPNSALARAALSNLTRHPAQPAPDTTPAGKKTK
jgi:tetratricopeptide (TPR) repeat protein